MQPVTHRTNNHIFTAGPDSPGDCADLPVTSADWYGTPSLITFWKPSVEELARLNAGQSVLVVVAGKVLPPLHIAVDSPTFYGELP